MASNGQLITNGSSNAGLSKSRIHTSEFPENCFLSFELRITHELIGKPYLFSFNWLPQCYFMKPTSFEKIERYQRMKQIFGNSKNFELSGFTRSMGSNS